RAGEVERALRLLRSAAKKLRAQRPQPLDLILERFQLELMALDLDEAARAAEAVLSRSKAYRDLSRLRSFSVKEFDFLRLPSGYKERAEAALDRRVDEHPDSPWGYYWRIAVM